ncbi:MAG: dephospho-CoA kinase [Candidatus Cloacimonetes bacterium]|nr:dephospho-CoA kinase [Candidatus Cloacimonadota bacterium]
MHPIYAIGLTGGISSGKSLAGTYLSRYVPVLDSDHLVHELYSSDQALINSIAEAFGSQCVGKEGVLRRKLREIVFKDSAQLELLNSIVRPKTSEVLLSRILSCKASRQPQVFMIPLLFENGWQKELDHVLLLGCSVETQVARILRRDGTDAEDARLVIAAQMPLHEKQKLCDYYIENEGEPQELYARLDVWWQSLMSESS